MIAEADNLCVAADENDRPEEQEFGNEESNTYHKNTRNKKTAEDAANNWCSLRSFFSAPQNQAKFRKVHEVFKYVLSIPCTQIPCERSFSIMKNIKTATRSNMSDAVLETYMVVRTGKEFLSSDFFPEMINRIAETSCFLRNRLLMQPT